MAIEAKVILDSVSPKGVRLTTFEVNYHRFIHGEVMTHRTKSRNSASSRAIPISKTIKDVEDNPAIPVKWGKNQSGMQAREELSPELEAEAREIWEEHRQASLEAARKLEKIGLHKQLTNRLLEPHMMHRVIITATDFKNFFQQRIHEDAQPEISTLAIAMLEARSQSAPTPLGVAEWHLPYLRDDDPWEDDNIETRIKVSVARCARVSYLTHDGKRDLQKDIDLYNMLSSQSPKHFSPMEHVATPDEGYFPSFPSNFRGWIQWRKLLENNVI